MSGWKIALIVAGVLVVIAVVFVMNLGSKMKKDMKNLEYASVDMKKVRDGSYIGESETTLVKVKVQVTVKDHEIQKIEILRHDNGKGKPAEKIVDEMVAENNYEVDAVSSATMSSEVIKSAVSKALKEGMKG